MATVLTGWSETHLKLLLGGGSTRTRSGCGWESAGACCCCCKGWGWATAVPVGSNAAGSAFASSMGICKTVGMLGGVVGLALPVLLIPRPLRLLLPVLPLARRPTPPTHTSLRPWDATDWATACCSTCVEGCIANICGGAGGTVGAGTSAGAGAGAGAGGTFGA